MALSKSQIKKIDKFDKQYYVLIPGNTCDVSSIRKYFNNDDSKYRVADSYCIYYVFTEKEAKDLKKYFGNTDVYLSENKYSNKQEIFNILKNRQILNAKRINIKSI